MHDIFHNLHRHYFLLLAYMMLLKTRFYTCLPACTKHALKKRLRTNELVLEGLSFINNFQPSTFCYPISRGFIELRCFRSLYISASHDYLFAFSSPSYTFMGPGLMPSRHLSHPKYSSDMGTCRWTHHRDAQEPYVSTL